VAQTAAGVAALTAARLEVLVALAAALFLVVATFGMVVPNATGLALDRCPDRAGTAAALLGAIQSVVAAAAAPVVGVLGTPGTGVPMSVVITGCAALGLLSMLTLASGGPRRRSGRRASVPPAPAPPR